MQEPDTCNGSEGYGWKGVEGQVGTRKESLSYQEKWDGENFVGGQRGPAPAQGLGSSGSGWLQHCVCKSWAGEICRTNKVRGLQDGKVEMNVPASLVGAIAGGGRRSEG